ncbi:MAG TPA: hypothetical protein PKA64_25745, partial [Myxococcota bacterium]|nr:hypothetical protein [Myxococcota bacterium]
MTDPHDPARLAADAAARIAADWKLGVTPSARVLHATAWILARAGRPVPEPPDPVSADLVATTA